MPECEIGCVLGLATPWKWSDILLLITQEELNNTLRLHLHGPERGDSLQPEVLGRDRSAEIQVPISLKMH